MPAQLLDDKKRTLSFRAKRGIHDIRTPRTELKNYYRQSEFFILT